MPIKDLPLSLRPREKAMRIGVKNLTDIELLAIFLRSGNKNFDVLDLSKDILKKYQSFKTLSSFNIHDLKKIKGIGIVKAIEIVALFEFAHRLTFEQQLTIINNAQEAANYAQSVLWNINQEQFLVVLLDQKNRIIYHEIMYKGALTFVTIEPHRIIGLALAFKAKKFYCFHNHPSGDPYPSFADRVISNKITNCAKLFNLKMVAHIIVCDKNNFHQF